MRQTLPFFCGKDCGGNACPLLAMVEDGRVTHVVNNPAGGKYIKGCRRGFDLPLVHHAWRRHGGAVRAARRRAWQVITESPKGVFRFGCIQSWFGA